MIMRVKLAVSCFRSRSSCVSASACMASDATRPAEHPRKGGSRDNSKVKDSNQCWLVTKLVSPDEMILLDQSSFLDRICNLMPTLFFPPLDRFSKPSNFNNTDDILKCINAKDKEELLAPAFS